MSSFFSPFRSLGMDARIKHIEDHLARFMPVTVDNASVAEQSAAFTSGGTGGSTGGNVEIFDDLSDVVVVDAIEGDLPVFDGTNWVSQDWTHSRFGIGESPESFLPSIPPKFLIWDNLGAYSAWFDGTNFNAPFGRAFSSAGWHFDKLTSQDPNAHTLAFSSSGALCWELGMAGDTSNALNFGFGNADFLLFDDGANGFAGETILRVSPEEAATGGTASKWVIGRGVTTPRASTALFEIKNPSATLRGLRLTTSVTQSVPLLDVIDGISQVYTTSVGNSASSLKGLHLNKTDNTSATSHGISWDVGTSGSGYGQWESGVDFDTNNGNKYADMVLLFDKTAAAGAGADVFRISHEADDGTVGSTSCKFSFGNAGGPRAFTSFFNIEAGDTLAGLRISANTSTSGRSHIALIQRAANNFGTISFNNAIRLISDNAKANVASLAVRDDLAGAIRLFMDSSGRFSIGTATTVTAMLMLPAGTATASSAPLKFTSGTSLTTAENGAAEYDGTDLFFTPSAATRKTVVLAPTSPSPYTPTNVSTDRSYDANATTLDEIADVLGTLIADLQSTKIIG